MKLAKRTLVVSGGSSGLGLATVRDLLAHNAHVAVLDLAPPPGDLPQDRLHFFQTDIAQTANVARAVAACVAWTRRTGAALGGVIHAAGVATIGKVIGAEGAPLSLDLYKHTLEVNVVGTFDLTRLVCQHLVTVSPEGPDEERGVVVMVSSAAAYEGQPGQVAYAASKGAVLAMTLPLARDLARYGIRVNAIAPGIFDSSMTTRMSAKTRTALQREMVYPRRFGRGREFAETVRWMLESSYMNGETVRLSGAARLPSRL